MIALIRLQIDQIALLCIVACSTLYTTSANRKVQEDEHRNMAVAMQQDRRLQYINRG